MPKRFPIIWLTGNTGAGKTTLAFGVRDYFNEQAYLDSHLSRRVVVLDGDEMRATISVEEGLSPDDRRKHNLRVARLAKLLSEHGFLIIVAVIAPFTKVRDELSEICNPKWIYIKRSGLEGNDRPYEPPQSPDLLIDNDSSTKEEGKQKLIAYIKGLVVGAEKLIEDPKKKHVVHII